MTTEPLTYHIKVKNDTRHAIKLILGLNMNPNNQLLKNEVASVLHFQPTSTRYTALQAKNSTRSVNSVTVENTDNKHDREPVSHYRDTKENKRKSIIHCQVMLDCRYQLVSQC